MGTSRVSLASLSFTYFMYPSRLEIPSYSIRLDASDMALGIENSLLSSEDPSDTDVLLSDFCWMFSAVSDFDNESYDGSVKCDSSRNWLDLLFVQLVRIKKATRSVIDNTSCFLESNIVFLPEKYNFVVAESLLSKNILPYIENIFRSIWIMIISLSSFISIDLRCIMKSLRVCATADRRGGA